MIGGLMVLYVIVVIATLAVIIAKRVKTKQAGELFRLKEINMTAVLGFLLWIEAGTILGCALWQPESIITSNTAKWNLYIFLLLSILLGSFMLLYYFVKCDIILENGVIGVSVTGKQTTLDWKEVWDVSLFNGKRLVMQDKGSTKKIVVGGEKKVYKEFVQLALKKTNPGKGRDVLKGLSTTL